MAYTELAVCYRDGIGVHADAELAAKYAKMAEDAGHKIPDKQED